ncbi:hypothetical protein COP2_007891 [Malus domestica]
MVSSISILGFPSMHGCQSATTRASAMESRITSLEAYITSLPSLINAAIKEVIDKAFATKLLAYFKKFRRELRSQGVEEGISTLLTVDHHVSHEIKPLQLP